MVEKVKGRVCRRRHREAKKRDLVDTGWWGREAGIQKEKRRLVPDFAVLKYSYS